MFDGGLGIHFLEPTSRFPLFPPNSVIMPLLSFRCQTLHPFLYRRGSKSSGLSQAPLYILYMRLVVVLLHLQRGEMGHALQRSI